MIVIRLTVFLALVIVPGALTVCVFSPKIRRLLMPRKLDLSKPLGDDAHPQQHRVGYTPPDAEPSPHKKETIT